MPVITSIICPRCGGSGQHSFNLRDGTVCYGCGGVGKVPCAPKGQPKIKVTAESYRAVPGDIIETACVLYRVEEIRWIKPITRGHKLLNQQMRINRLVDGRVMYLKRMFFGYDPSAGVQQMKSDGSRQTANSAIHTPDALIGTLYEVGQYGKDCIVV